jgi:hypothetical protein
MIPLARLPRLALVAALLAPVLVACGPKESIVAVGEGKKLSAEQIDADPLALLPGGAVFLWQADAKALLNSSLGPSALRTAQALLPLTPEMNFEPRRDLRRFVGAGYSVQGADFAMIAQGNFDPDAIKAVASRGGMSAAGRPFQKTSYGGNDLFLTGDLGFVVLTSQSLLVGNPAGLRRSLDRIRDARVRREVPDWAEELLRTEGAELVLAGDVAGQSVSAAAAQQAPFVQRLSKVRLVGDFKDPGVNLAGALTYEDGPAAAAGNDQIRAAGAQAGALNLMFFMGISNPLRNLQTNLQGNDVQLVAQIDGPALGGLMERAAAQLRAAPPVASR